MSSSNSARLSAWLIFWLSSIVAIAFFFMPAFIIRPFTHQSARGLALAMAMRQSAPLPTLIAALLCIVLAVLLWESGNLRRKIVLSTVVVLVLFSAVMSRLNYFEWMFHPVDSPQFEAEAASKLAGKEMILAVQYGPDARAYPIREMAYHHILNDVVQGVPIAVTYWTLCHTGLVWTRTVNGRVLHFYLAGINNQNFIMRDKETGSWWQQITGKAIYGPLKGATLELVPSDELTFGQWKSEVSHGQVLAPVAKYVKEYDSDWEPEVAKLPVVISFPGTELKPRDIVVGLEMDGASRAYPWDKLVKQSPVVDRVNGKPILIAVGPDGKSFRVFVSRIDGQDAEFFLKGDNEIPANPSPADAKRSSTAATPGPTTAAASGNTKTPANAPSSEKPWVLLDTSTASEWNFQGCAVSGPAQGKCLDRVPALKDYWFDWRNYHPETTVYKR